MPDQQPIDGTDAAAREPIDPYVDLRQARAVHNRRDDATMLAAIAAIAAGGATGGATGAEAQYLIRQAWPTPAGFTTFSTYTVDIQRLVAGAHAVTALLYLALTPIGALLAVWVTATATRRLVNWRTQ
ncbi:MAG: fluoride efflux transporter FluC [Dermatophilaceae bacterium]